MENKKEEKGFFDGIIDMAGVIVTAIVTAAVAVFAYQWLQSAEFASEWNGLTIGGVTALIAVAALFVTNRVMKYVTKDNDDSNTSNEGKPLLQN